MVLEQKKGQRKWMKWRSDDSRIKTSKRKKKKEQVLDFHESVAFHRTDICEKKKVQQLCELLHYRCYRATQTSEAKHISAALQDKLKSASLRVCVCVHRQRRLPLSPLFVRPLLTAAFVRRGVRRCVLRQSERLRRNDYGNRAGD